MDVALAADKGGVGKTVLAYHLATRLKQLGYDVALLDLDRRSASSAWVRRAETPFFPAYPLGSFDELPDHAVRIWDTPAHPSAEMRSHLAGICDLVVVVTLVDPASHEAAVDCYRAFVQAGAEPRVLLNGVHPTSSEGRDSVDALRAAGIDCFDSVVRRYNCYHHSHWEGRAVCDYPYPSADKAWSDISDLADEILAATEASYGQNAA
jgi:chromosome partitioning protein